MTDFYSATNTGPAAPKPHRFTLEEALAINVYGQGVRFFYGDDDEELTYDTLAFCVRNDERFGFADGETIADAGSHSDAELWSDVIAPAIVDGRIEYAVWGVVQNLTD